MLDVRSLGVEGGQGFAPRAAVRGGGTAPVWLPPSATWRHFSWRRAHRFGVRSGDLDRPAREFDRDDTVSNRKGAALTAHQFQAVAKALADPRRMALLESIGSERECSCQKLCSESGITKGTVSHHMRELVRAGLIEERREGQYMFYEMRRDVLAAYVAELMRRVVPVSNT
jgi:ArsR family transcriptional regulator, arsenate/arsenite/antimonite-responsive transcriptional repressor